MTAILVSSLFYSTTKSVECTPCSDGEYSDTPGAISCNKCDNGEI